MRSSASGVVVFHLSHPDDFLHSHEGRTLTGIAETIARLKRYTFAGRWNEAHRAGRVFVVPDDTLVESEARRLGIGSAADLFGGVVPHAFVKTKSISHALIGENADRPAGWSHAFSARTRDVVLPGYTAFSARDAERAASLLAADGAVRVKRPLAAGGMGQSVVRSPVEVTPILEHMPVDELHESGLVLETHLSDVTTRSVGHVMLDEVTMSYHGTQRLTHDVEGRSAYGGSDLVCVRGGWDALDRLAVPPEIRHGIAQARAYDDATNEYAGFMASRRNYDVGQGLDGRGRWRSGVFEASWRIGGASGAEIAALETFMADSTVDVVHASSVQQFGDGIEPPPGARVYFHGHDPALGPMIRCALVTRVLRRTA